MAGIAGRLKALGWEGDLRRVRLPNGVKDLNEMSQRDPESFADRLRGLLEGAEPISAEAVQEAETRPRSSARGRGESQATCLVELGAKAELWHTPEGEAYATILVSGRRENLPVRSRAFRQWLARLFYAVEGKTPAGQALQDALNVLEGRALYEDSERSVYLRVAKHRGHTYLDLADGAWRTVEITPDGWRVVQNPPVHFRRARGMLPLPEPIQGGSLNLLERYINSPCEDECRLLLAWLVETLNPTGSYPILVLQGEQGSGKSLTARVLRVLVDPNVAALRTIPRDKRDLMLAA